MRTGNAAGVSRPSCDCCRCDPRAGSLLVLLIYTCHSGAFKNATQHPITTATTATTTTTTITGACYTDATISTTASTTSCRI